MNSIYAKYLDFHLLKIPISLSFKKKYLGSTITIFGAILIIVYFIIRLNQIISKSIFTIISTEFQNPKGEIDFSNTPINIFPYLYNIKIIFKNIMSINKNINHFFLIFI